MLTDTFEISQKDGFANIVTSSDLAVQNFLRERLASLLPGCGFLCEEEDMHDTEKEYTWIIDPIDGTANYSRGIRECAICVGLKHDDHMEMSVVYLPRTDEMFSAEYSKGAWLNGKRIHVSDRPFEDAILCTALAVYYKEYAQICSDIIVEAFGQINAYGVSGRRLQSYAILHWDVANCSLSTVYHHGIMQPHHSYSLRLEGS